MIKEPDNGNGRKGDLKVPPFKLANIVLSKSAQEIREKNSDIRKQYQVKSMIGRGTYGKVWLAKHIETDKYYVIKSINVSNTSTDRIRRSAVVESKLLTKLHHPHIVSCRQTFRSNTSICIVMTYCEGGDLYTKLKARNGLYLDENVVLAYFIQITMALQYLHRKSVIHRDLKSKNIFLTKSDIVKIGDFGISKIIPSGQDMSSTLIGTPYYMSPEMVKHKPYNFKSDIWSLGCVLYEMLCLQHAFGSEKLPQLINEIVKNEIKPIPAKYSTQCSLLVRILLSKNPEMRPNADRILNFSYVKKHRLTLLDTIRRKKGSSKVEKPVTNEKLVFFNAPVETKKSVPKMKIEKEMVIQKVIHVADDMSPKKNSKINDSGYATEHLQSSSSANNCISKNNQISPLTSRLLNVKIQDEKTKNGKEIAKAYKLVGVNENILPNIPTLSVQKNTQFSPQLIEASEKAEALHSICVQHIGTANLRHAMKIVEKFETQEIILNQLKEFMGHEMFIKLARKIFQLKYCYEVIIKNCK